jgi:hypothetical protein
MMIKKLLHLTVQQHERLKKLSATTGLNISELIRRAIDYYLIKQEKKEVKAVQFFRPKDEGALERISPDEIINTAYENMSNCESWKKQVKEKWEKGKITEKEYKNELKKQDEMIEDAKKTIIEAVGKKIKKGGS